MKKPAIVTDHAVVRYLQRVRGVDIEAVRKEIGHTVDHAIGRADRIMPMPDPTGVIVDGIEYCIANGHVTTVQRAHHPDPRSGRVRGDRPE